MTYPTCARSFLAYCVANPPLFHQYMKHICGKHVRPFDVTLRDGLQALTYKDQLEFTTERKRRVYYDIIGKHNPKHLEVGACVNDKVLPMFSDTQALFRHIDRSGLFNNYVLVPNEERLSQALAFGASNLSFITSVSNSFQLKNTKMTIAESCQQLENMMVALESTLKPFRVKLYVSCINECPIEGRIATGDVIQQVVKLRHSLKPDRICLSDTCGTLTAIDFLQIMKGLMEHRIERSTLSLHLHVRPERESEVERIVHMALDHGIVEFDVSDLASGGCSVTMDKSKLAPNMNYAQYYKFLTTYLMKMT